MEASKGGRRSEHVAQLPAPWVDRTKRHLLRDIVVSAVCAVIGGADTWADIEAYGRAKVEWWKRFLPLPHGIPSHNTFAQVFARVEPEACRTCFLAWLTEVQERIGAPLASQLVAIEGRPHGTALTARWPEARFTG